jgi:hypothetical protein
VRGYCFGNELNCYGVRNVDDDDDDDDDNNNKPLSLNFKTTIHSNFIP